MARFTSQGPKLSLAPGKTMEWFTAYPAGANPGIVIQDPNIKDDPFVPLRLDVISRSVQWTDDGFTAFVVVRNPGKNPIVHNLNIEDWQ